jgi:hypothetical protein
VTNSMLAVESRYAEALLEARRRTHLLQNLQTTAHADHFDVSGDGLNRGDKRPEVAVFPECEAQIGALLRKILRAEFQRDRLYIAGALRVIAIVTQLHLGHEPMGLRNPIKRDAGGVWAAASERLQHRQQDFAEGLMISAGLSQETNNSAHNISVILVVYYKYYRQGASFS